MRRAWLLLASTLTAVLAVSAAAMAGSYQVRECTGAAPLVNNSWQPFDNNPSFLETSPNCGGSLVSGGSSATSGLAVADVLRLSSNVPAGTVAGWRFTAPEGDSVTAVTMDRDLYEQSEGWAPQVIDAEGVVLPGETCPFNAGAGGCEVSGASTQNGLDTRSVAIELLCDPEPVQLTACANGYSEHDARVELGGATVTVEDRQLPQITSTGGSLFAGALVQGVLSGTIEGSDSSGVQDARLYVDGAQVAEEAFSCEYTRPAPCPTTSTSQFSLNTGGLSNGPHEIQVALIDAAGNQALTAPVQITVDRTPPSAPAGLLVNGQPGGAWINQPATISWSNPTQPADDPITQVNWVACAGSESSVPASGCEAEQHQDSPLGSLTFNPGLYPAFRSQPQGVYTVFVWLEDSLGNTSRANSAAVSFGYQTTPPPPPASIGVSGHGPYTITLGAPADPAPLVATHWVACDSAGACTGTQTSPGLSFSFAPGRTPQFERSPYGGYAIRAWLQDAAGNTSPANAAALTLTDSKPSPQLRILHVARTGSRLRVRGGTSPAVGGVLTVLVRYTLDEHSRTTQATVPIVMARWVAALPLLAGTRIDRVTVMRRSSARWRAEAVSRYFHRVSTRR